MPVRILIADDDPGMRILLTGIVQSVADYDLVGTACDGEELLLLYDQQKPQVVIMDVEMPGKTGIECAEVIQDRDPRCILIFASAHEKYMGDAFRVYAFDYLVKPFKVDRAKQTLEKAAQRIAERREAAGTVREVEPKGDAYGSRLVLKNRDGVSFIDMDDIVLIQREDRQTVLYAQGDRRYVTTDTLSELEGKLDPKVFVRTHKSYIVNITRIDTVMPYGRWTYVATIEGTKQDGLITAEKFEELKNKW